MTDAVSPQLNTASGDTAAEVVEDVLTTAQDRAMTVAHRGLPAPGEATADDVMPHTLHDNHSDLVDLPLIGKITVPGGIYTAVFGILAILTLFEVLIAELLDPALIGAPDSFGYGAATVVKIILLLGIALGKAALVVWFYMHLNSDSRFFLLVLILPTIIALTSALYLLLIPSASGGLGYLPG